MACDNTSSTISAKNLDLIGSLRALVAHFATNVDLVRGSRRSVEVEANAEFKQADRDGDWHPSLTDIITNWNRLLSRLHPYALASAVAKNGEDWLTETKTLCVPRTSFVLISRENRLTSAHHDRAVMFRTDCPGRAIQVEEPA